MMKSLSLLAVLSLGLWASEQVHAAILFSDLGPAGSPYTIAPGSLITGGTSHISQARSFTVAGTGQFDLTQIDVGVVYSFGDGSFTASIWTSASGHPGALLASLGTLVTTTPGGSSGLTTLTGVTGVTLTGGTQYFMVLGPSNPSNSSHYEWEPNNQGATGSIFGSLDGGSTWIADGTGTNTAFDVIGTAVPEPASLALIAIGMGALGIRRRRRVS